jgi:hypothetical protein
MYLLSSPLRKRAWAGDLGSRMYERAPKANVNDPSRMKIHAQPCWLPMPFICMIPNARRPENAPEIDAAEKKAEILRWKREREYCPFHMIRPRED